jgi:hypothetical protein
MRIGHRDDGGFTATLQLGLNRRDGPLRFGMSQAVNLVQRVSSCPASVSFIF